MGAPISTARGLLPTGTMTIVDEAAQGQLRQLHKVALAETQAFQRQV